MVAAQAEAEMVALAPAAVAAVEIEDMPEPELVRVRDIQPMVAWAILAGMGVVCAVAAALAMLAGR